MVRFVIIGIVIAVAFSLYALVDAAMTDGSRARGVNKFVWLLIIVLLPVIGGLLWFMIGKGAASMTRPKAPDDDPRFTGTRMSKTALDEELRDLEDRLRELDAEVYPGEAQAEAQDQPEPQSPAEPQVVPDSAVMDSAVQDSVVPDQEPHDEVADAAEKSDPEVKPNPDGDAGAARK